MSKDSRSATFSPGSGDGRMRSGSRDGRMTKQSGRGAARASPSPSRGKEKGKRMSGIYGRTSAASSASVSLQSALENRLHQRLDVSGSIEWRLIWKQWSMPSGMPICALRALGRRTLDSGCGGWPSPQTRDYKSGRAEKGKLKKHQLNLDDQAVLAGWSSLRVNKRGLPDAHGSKEGPILAGWTTPQTHDSQGNGSADRLKRHGTKHGCKNLQDEVHLIVVGWQSPTCGDAKGSDLSVRPSRQKQTASIEPGRNFWDAFTLIPCLDSKLRRIEPGTFPLAHGVPARMGKLRAYGNAIVPQVAAEFIRAYMEC